MTPEKQRQAQKRRAAKRWARHFVRATRETLREAEDHVGKLACVCDDGGLYMCSRCCARWEMAEAHHHLARAYGYLKVPGRVGDDDV